MNFGPRQRELGDHVLHSLEHFFSGLGDGDYAIAYSGGLDSTVLLALACDMASPYTLGGENSRDLENALRGSEILGIPDQIVRLDSIDVEKYVSILLEIDPGIGKQDIGFELVLAILLDSVKEEAIITGQGADEIFYGYHRFIEDPGLTNRGHLKKLWNETLPREKALGDYFGKRLITPYLNKDVLEILEETTRDDHFTDRENKAILRYVAETMGLPGSITGLRKKAAQYGSGIMNRLRQTDFWNSR